MQGGWTNLYLRGQHTKAANCSSSSDCPSFQQAAASEQPRLAAAASAGGSCSAGCSCSPHSPVVHCERHCLLHAQALVVGPPKVLHEVLQRGGGILQLAQACRQAMQTAVWCRSSSIACGAKQGSTAGPTQRAAGAQSLPRNPLSNRPSGFSAHDRDHVMHMMHERVDQPVPARRPPTLPHRSRHLHCQLILSGRDVGCHPVGCTAGRSCGQHGTPTDLQQPIG